MKGVNWTNAENATLRAEFSAREAIERTDHFDRRIGKMLDRPVVGVKCQRLKLGLNFSRSGKGIRHFIEIECPDKLRTMAIDSNVAFLAACRNVRKVPDAQVPATGRFVRLPPPSLGCVEAAS
jgi:hypothetical protein